MKIIVNLLQIALMLAITPSAFAKVVPGPLVEADWLVANQNRVVILDVRADVKSFVRAPVYVKDKKSGNQKLVRVGGHIPGAVLVNYKHIRATREINGKKVEKIIPDKTSFEGVVQRLGVNRDSAVVIVTKGENNLDMTMATRLYWQLKYFGHDDVAILNGGTAQWLLAGNKVDSNASKERIGNWQARDERPQLLATSEEVEAMMKSKGQLVDNRPLSQYLGTYKKSYVYQAGHIPGAKSFPNELLTSHGLPARFPDRNQLKSLSEIMGIDTSKASITYCNSGHLASGGWFVLSEVMGNKDVQLYDGSMHEWTLENHPVSAMKME